MAIEKILSNVVVDGTISKVGGTSSQFLKADGSVDSTTYTTNTGTVTSVTAGNGMTQSGTSTINPTLNIVSHAGSAGTIGTINIGADAIGVNLGTTSTTAAAGNDARLSDARTPLAHNQAWSTITSTPTTLSGYGITDAAPISGSANYIQNGTTLQTANFNISGSGTLGTDFGFSGTTGNHWILFPGSATHSGAMQIQAGYGSAIAGGGISLFGQGHATQSGDVEIAITNTNSMFKIVPQMANGSTPVATITRTGAATFASTVTAPEITLTNVDGYSAKHFLPAFGSTSDYYAFRVTSPNSTYPQISFQQQINGTGGAITDVLTISSARNATFFGSVAASNGTLIGGTLTSGYIPKATGANSLGNSILSDNGATVTALANSSGTIDTRLIIGGTGNGGTGRGTAIRIDVPGSANSVSGAKINAYTTGGAVSTQSVDLAFDVALNGTLTERMRILSNGNVLIGTTTDNGNKLRVAAGNISIDAGYKLQYSSTAYMTPENNVNGAEIATGGIFTLKTGGTTERLRVDASGNVGIGTVNPTLKLEVYDGATNEIASFKGASNSVPFQILGNVNAGDYWRGVFTGHNIITNATTGKPSIRTAGFRASAIGYSADSLQGYMGFFTTNSTTANTDLSERMRITEGGNVLIGTTTDNSNKLRVEGDTYISGKVSLSQSTYHKPATTQCAGEIVYYGTGTTVAGKLYYLSTGLVWTLADSDAAASSSGMLGIAIGTNPATNGMLVRGSARFDALTPYTAMTAGQILYVSTTAGDFTATAPTGTGKVVRVIGYCVDDTNNTLYFCPDNTWIELT